jgi:hypothetical protein
VKDESPVGDRLAMLTPGAIEHDAGQIHRVDLSGGADPFKEHSQAQAAAEADIGGDVPFRERHSVDRCRDIGSVGPIEHGSDPPAREAVRVPQLRR